MFTLKLYIARGCAAPVRIRQNPASLTYLIQNESST